MKAPRTRRQISINIVGAGRLGTALAIALSGVGHEIRALVGRNAKRASGFLRRPPLALTKDQIARLPPADLTFLTVPDDAIASTAAKLAQHELNRQGSVVVHTSGALSAAVLQPLNARGVHTGSFHPLVSVSDPVAGAERLGHAFFCLEGDAAAQRLGRSIVRQLGGKSFSVPAERKALYHAAAVMSSGHMTALFDIATEMLEQCGLTANEARKVLLPLLSSTVSNLENATADKALTGTFARGDRATVIAHLEAFEKVDLDQALAAYRLLGDRSLKLAGERGMSGVLRRELAQLLDGVENKSKTRKRTN